MLGQPAMARTVPELGKTFDHVADPAGPATWSWVQRLAWETAWTPF